MALLRKETCNLRHVCYIYNPHVCVTHMCVLHTCVCYTHVCVTHMCVLHPDVSREQLNLSSGPLTLLNLDEMTTVYMYIYRALKGLDKCDMNHIVRALNFIKSR